MTSAQGQWWRRLHNWADVIHADFQTVISRVQQNINTYPFCTAERMLRTVIMQNSRLIQACFPIKIDEVWIDRFCVRYDWWRRLQRTSSVSPVCFYVSLQNTPKLLIVDFDRGSHIESGSALCHNGIIGHFLLIQDAVQDGRKNSEISQIISFVSNRFCNIPFYT